MKACAEALDLDPLHFGVEFTQHAGDEILPTILIDCLVRGGLARESQRSEAITPLAG